MATKWLSVTQAARRLNVSESTIWRLLRRSTLASAKIRGRRVIAATAVRALGREIAAPERTAEVRIFTLEDPLLRLAGKFRSDLPGPGSSDKHRHLGDAV